jgi:hypothetical protein
MGLVQEIALRAFPPALAPANAPTAARRAMNSNRDYETEPQRWRGGRSAAERERHYPRRRSHEEWIAMEVLPIIGLCRNFQL